jgi:hypothetical protein
MNTAMEPRLRTGRVYRTSDLEQWSSNPTRLAARLVDEGKLRKLRHGLYYRPKRGRFGEVPPNERELVRSFLGSQEFVLTGPDKWNSLGLGSTGVAATRLVYNRQRTNEVELDGRRFRFRRVRFPRAVTPEWYVVDLFENAGLAGVDRGELSRNLRRAVDSGTFDPDALLHAASEYGSRATQRAVQDALT